MLNAHSKVQQRDIHISDMIEQYKINAFEEVLVPSFKQSTQNNFFLNAIVVAM